MVHRALTRLCFFLKTAILMYLMVCYFCDSRLWAASGEPGLSKDSTIELLDKLSSGSLSGESAGDYRKQILKDIENNISDAFETDNVNAQRKLKEIGRAIKEQCEKHKAPTTGAEDTIALTHLGPIAFRAYLDVAKRQSWGQLIWDYFTKGREKYLGIRQSEWDHEFLADCTTAICDVMAAYERLLATKSTSGSQTSYEFPDALVPTLEAICEMGRVVEVNDLPAFQYALICPEQQGKDIGNASRNPMVALARVIMNPPSDEKAQVAAINALGAVASAYGVFFQAVTGLPDTAKAKLGQLNPGLLIVLGKQIDLAKSELAKIFLKNMKKPRKFASEESTYPSRVTAQLVTLLKSANTPTQCSVAKAFGQVMPAAMHFVGAVGQMLQDTGVGLDPGASRDIFGLANSNFEAIFALTDAAIGKDSDVRSCARESLDRIFQVSDGEGDRNKTQISVVVDRLISLLKTAEGADALDTRPDERYAVENEAFNSLLAIPSATRETVARMEEVERVESGTETGKYARLSKERLRGLAGMTASRIQEEFSLTTDLYRARRYLLILRLYGEALPDRPMCYYGLLCAHAKVNAKTELPVKRLLAQDALEAFKSTDGTRREIERNTLETWRDQVLEWKKGYADTNGDSVMQQYLGSINDEIVRLKREGYSIPYRLWQRFSQLNKPAQFFVVSGLLYSLVVISIGFLWLVVPWQLTVWAMERPMREGFPHFSKHATDILTLTHWLGAGNRALDAWIAHYQNLLVNQTFRLECESQPLGEDVPDRVQYLIDHYVDIGNRKHDKAFCDAIRKQKALAVWIGGEGGGSGKTTLACHMAHTAYHESGRPLIPVIVNVNWGHSLIDTVRRLCQIDGRLLTPGMTRNLAGRGRIVLVIDGLSEICQTLDGEAAAFRHFVVTSRAEPPENKKYSTVRVGALNIEDTAGLNAFVGAYTRKEKTRKRALKLIRGLADAKGCIRPVFAWLAVDHVEEHADLLADKDHYSQLDLVVTCVRRQRPRGPHALSEYDYARAAELVAYTMMHRTWAPCMFPRETVQSRLHEEGKRLPFRSSSGAEIPGDVVLGQLEGCGLLKSGSIKQTSMLARHSFVSFSHDVMAEYLAAVYVAKWPEIPLSTIDEIQRSGGDFADILEKVKRAMTDHGDCQPA